MVIAANSVEILFGRLYMSSRHLFNTRAFAAIVIVVSSSFVALSGVASAAPSTITVDGVVYDATGSGTIGYPYVATVTGQTGNAATVTIPSTITSGGTTYSVTAIGNTAFLEDTYLASVIIPNSVTAIGIAAFEGDTSLTSVTIPNSVQIIRTSAFQGDTALTSITIPDSVTSIADQAFDQDTALTSITLPNSITSISNNVFYGDTSLASITIPSSVTSIGTLAFYANTSLTSITIPNSVTSIGVGAFYGDTALTFIDSSGFVATWSGIGGPYTTAQLGTATNNGAVTGTWANTLIYSYSGSTATVTGQTGNAATETIPSTITSGGTTYSVTAIGNTAFLEDTYLASVIIPNSVTAIGIAAFEGDTSLTSVTIPNSVQIIRTSAFQGDTALTSITIPDSVTSIADQAFDQDTALTSITLPNSVTSIGTQAFYGNTALASITIPNSVTSIGGNAFSGDTGLTLSNPTDYVATWSGTGGPYTTAQLRTATDLGQVTGTWASVVRVAPIIYSKPTAPSNVTVSLSNGTATVSFTPGSSGNLATYDEIDMYINGQLVGNVCNVSGATSCPIANLGPDAAFSFTVTEINSKGSAVSTVSNTVGYSSPAVVTTTTTSPPTTTTTVPPVKRTITCVKGKISKKVTAVSPVCPAGYKKK